MRPPIWSDAGSPAADTPLPAVHRWSLPCANLFVMLS